MNFDNRLNLFSLSVGCLFFSMSAAAPVMGSVRTDSVLTDSLLADNALIDGTLISQSFDTSAGADSAEALPFPTVIGTEILDGLIEVEKRISRTRIGLTVNLLGDSSLVDWQISNDIPTATLFLGNDELGDDIAIDRAISAAGDAEEQAILRAAISYLQSDSEMYNTYWKPAIPPEPSGSGVNLDFGFNDSSSSNAPGGVPDPFAEDELTTDNSVSNDLEGIPDPFGQGTSSGIQSLEDVLNLADVTASDYFSLLRDRNVARNLLLRTQSLEYRLTMLPEANYEPSPFDDERFTTVDRDVKWEIKVYQSKVSAEPEIVYYRFAIRAVADPRDFAIPTSYLNNRALLISAAAFLVQDNGQRLAVSGAAGFENVGEMNTQGFGLDRLSSLTIPENTGSLKKVKTIRAGFQNVLENATADVRPNRSSNVLSFFGEEGALAGLIGRALTQSPTQDNSIVSGGLIDFSGDSNPQALFGINQGLASFGGLDAGLLFGATANTDTAIFVGPSLRYSLMTLGIGAQIAGEDSLEVDAAGVISVDLSRVLEDDKSGPEVIAVGSPNQGGTVGELARLIAEDQMIALVSFAVPPELDVPPEVGEGVAIDFFRLTTDPACQVTEDPNSSSDDVEFTVVPEGKHFLFLPQGCYEGRPNVAAMSVMDNYRLIVNGQERRLNETGGFVYTRGEDTLQKMNLQMIPR